MERQLFMYSAPEQGVHQEVDYSFVALKEKPRLSAGRTNEEGNEWFVPLALVEDCEASTSPNMVAPTRQFTWKEKAALDVTVLILYFRGWGLLFSEI